MDWVVYLLAAVVLYVVYEVIRAVKAYQANVKKAEALNIPAVKQFLPIHSLLFLFFPSFIRARLYNRNFSHTAIVNEFERLNAPLIGLVSYEGILIFVNDPALVKQICLTKKNVIHKANHLYNVLRLYGENIVTTGDGPDWKKHRVAANPAFNEDNCALVTQSTLKQLRRMFDKWERNDNIGNVSSDCVTLALAVISEAGFGEEIDLFSEKTVTLSAEQNHNIKTSFTDVMEIISNHTLARLLLPKIVTRTIPLPFFQKVERGFADFEEYARFFIKKRRAEQSTKKDLLTLLLNDSNLSDQDVVADTFMFFVAGHETTANTLGFTFALLAEHPEVQDKVCAEAKRVLDGVDEADYYEKLHELEYAKAVFDETLRLYPSVVAIPKWTMEDTTIGDYMIPAQTQVNLAVYALHRNPKVFPEPNKFNPDRFIEHPPSAQDFIPFSLGSRSCIGRKFAIIEACYTLAVTCRKYKIDAVNSDLSNIVQGITLKPKNPIVLKFTPRT